MQCNIDARGKAVRLFGGFGLLVAAVIVLGCSVLHWMPPRIGFILAGTIALVGGFGVFEGWTGWCAVRATGFRTPL